MVSPPCFQILQDTWHSACQVHNSPANLLQVTWPPHTCGWSSSGWLSYTRSSTHTHTPYTLPYICKQPVAKCLANTGNKTRLTTAGTTAPPIEVPHEPHTSHSRSRSRDSQPQSKWKIRLKSQRLHLSWPRGWDGMGWGWGSAGVQLKLFSRADLSIHWAKELLSRTLWEVFWDGIAYNNIICLLIFTYQRVPQ